MSTDHRKSQLKLYDKINFIRESVHLQVLAKQLAEVLLRGVCERMYEKPVYVNTNIPGSTASLSRGAAAKVESPKTTSVNTSKSSFSLKPLVNSGDRFVLFHWELR